MRVDKQFDRFFAALRTIAELGPLATSGEDFPRVAASILDRVLEGMDASSGALLYHCDLSHSLICSARAGMDALPLNIAMRLAPTQKHNWELLRAPRLVDNASLREFFSDSPERCAGTQCLMPLQAGPELVGALCLGPRRTAEPYTDSDFEALQLLSGHLALLMQNRRLHESLRLQIEDNLRLVLSLHHSYDDALQAFAATIDVKTLHTKGHSVRVARYAAAVASALGMDEAQKEGIRAAGHLHDIGSVTLDKSLVGKATPLLPAELREIADHTTVGHQIVSGMNFPWPQLPDVVRWHHERADGSGYPDKLRLDELSLPVRIIGVADTFDAMTSERPHRHSITLQQAAREMVRMAPDKFDSNVVQALLIQLRRDAEGKSTIGFAEPERVGELDAVELDRLCMALVTKTTHGKVHFA